jgi:hypothetical protein
MAQGKELDPELDIDGEMTKKIFTYEEAAALLPEVQRLTTNAVEEVERLALVENDADERPANVAEYEEIVSRWARAVIDLGIEVKGLWLIDFDNGSGYYCWKYPEPGLQFFHEYDTGFGGRVQLN